MTKPMIKDLHYDFPKEYPHPSFGTNDEIEIACEEGYNEALSQCNVEADFSKCCLDYEKIYDMISDFMTPSKEEKLLSSLARQIANTPLNELIVMKEGE